MPLLIVRNNIANMSADAIVNPANEELLEGSGTSRSVFLAAGEELLAEACRRIGHCDEGCAVATPAFGLQAKCIIHAVGPFWIDGTHGEQAVLAQTYRAALELAEQQNCRSVAFPLLSSGNYRFPKNKAFQTAMAAIGEFLQDHDMMVYLVLYDGESVAVSKKLYTEIEEYIDEYYVSENNETLAGDEFYSEIRLRAEMERLAPSEDRFPAKAASAAFAAPADEAPCIEGKQPLKGLDSLMRNTGESFRQMLFRVIDGKGMKDPDVYKRANLSKQHFSKIKNAPGYNPKKSTVLALAVALRLSLGETTELLQKAGYALTNSSKRDIIVQYFIEEGRYDINDINIVLYDHDQELLGS